MERLKLVQLLLMLKLLRREHKPHEIRPVNGKVLAFKVAGKMIFTPIVHHPGTRANPFLERAVDEASGKVESVFADLWLELVGG